MGIFYFQHLSRHQFEFWSGTEQAAPSKFDRIILHLTLGVAFARHFTVYRPSCLSLQLNCTGPQINTFIRVLVEQLAHACVVHVLCHWYLYSGTDQSLVRSQQSYWDKLATGFSWDQQATGSSSSITQYNWLQLEPARSIQNFFT